MKPNSVAGENGDQSLPSQTPVKDANQNQIRGLQQIEPGTEENADNLKLFLSRSWVAFCKGHYWQCGTSGDKCQ